MSYEHDIDLLSRQITSLRREVRMLTKYVDTVSSPLWKRVWWWFGGYYFRQVGRWYAMDSRRFRVWHWIAKRIGCE